MVIIWCIVTGVIKSFTYRGAIEMSEDISLISVDIGGATCKLGRVDSAGEVTDVERVKTDEVRQQGVEYFLELLKKYDDKYPVKGVTIGLPATVDWEGNYVRSECPDLPWMEEPTTLGRLQDQLGCPVRLVNDVEALLVGEWRQGELSGLNSGVVLTLGENMGSALLWNGRPQQGRRGSIMELEHISLNTGGEIVGQLPPGAACNWLSGKGLRYQLKSRGIDLTVPQLFALEGGPGLEVRREFELKLAHLLGTVVMMLDPEKIVLTGGLTGSYKSWLKPVEEKMNQFILKQFQGLPIVSIGQLCGDEVLLGPAAFWDWMEVENSG